MTQSSDPLESKKGILAAGFYAQKLLFSKFRILSWSHARRFKVARKLIQTYKGSTLLDYGCGDGTFIEMNLDLFPKSTGLDRDAQTLAYLKTRFADYKDLSFIAELPDDTKFDVIACMEVFEHCLPQIQSEILNTINEHLEQDGHILISVPIEVGFPLLLKQLGRRIAAFLKVKHYQYMETYTLSEVLKAVFATRNTSFERKIYAGGQIGHKGFNWRNFKKRIESQFKISKIAFSPLPLPLVAAQFSSQVFFLCEKRKLLNS